MSLPYVHGFQPSESLRLADQAATLSALVHADTAYPEHASVLEAGCGIGAQTIELATRSPRARITAIDASATSLALAKRRMDDSGITNVTFARADIFALPFEPESFDHVFVCFVLEHLAKPVEALRILRRCLKPGGSVTVVEGDHGSAYFHPDSAHARKAIAAQVALQASAGGNALIGRELFPLLREAGFANVVVSPRMVYVDGSRPELVEGFTKKTFTAMIAGVRESAIAASLLSPAEFDRGLADLARCAARDGVLCYTFFKAVATKIAAT